MNFSTLVKRNLRHFWRTNLAVVLGVGTAVAVLAGALLVGDSVRASLRELALARLGKTDLAIVAAGFFRDQLAADVGAHEQFAAHFNAACPLIALAGQVTNDANNARAGGVQVYGVDERFWQFHGANVQTLADNDALVSQSLAAELGVKPDDTLILRLEKPSAIPVESLHGRKEDVGVTVRFKLRETLPLRALGEFSLRPQQGGVRALFMPLRRLQRNLDQDGKANVLLLAAKQADGQMVGAAEQILKDKFTLADLGLKLRVLEAQQAVALESDAALISDVIVEKAKAAANNVQADARSFLTYLANTIRIGQREIPYSLVTALEIPKNEGEEGERLLAESDAPVPPIVLNKWAGDDLGARSGEEVELDYYLWQESGQLVTRTARFRLVTVANADIPFFNNDRDLAPEYPGITEAKSLADWDPPFPLDLGRVRERDEDYWNAYRTAPKAFIALGAGQKLWATRYGKVTSMRVFSRRSVDLETLRREYEPALRQTLDPVQMGLSIQPVKEQSLQAARGATDFGEYFAYFSFFLVVSALLLTTLFFKLGIEQRLREVGLLRAVGYTTGQIRALFLREGLALAVVGSAVGLIGALLYGWLMMWGLRTWWVGAVGTTLLELHVTPRSLLIGGLAGVVAALVCVWWTLHSLRRISPRSLLMGTTGSARKADVRSSAFGRLLRRAEPPKGGTSSAIFTSARLALIFGVLGLLLLLGAAFKLIGQVGGFFGAGTLLLIALLCFWSAWLRSDKKQTIAGQGVGAMWRLGFRNASTRPGRSVLCIALIAAASFIIVSVDAFRRDSNTATLDKNSGTGGYPLLAESLLPIVRDLNSAEGREELNLNDEALQGANLTHFRLRPGDDASCLNLYQPRNPRILGAPDNFINQARFAFQSSLAQTDSERANPWLLLNQELDDDAAGTNNPQSVVPVIADANSLNYVLHLKLGEELTINADDGRPVRLRVVAALSDSILQGELLMAERNFLKVFPNQEGFRFFLIDAAPEQTTGAAAVLEDKLSDFGFDATSTATRLAEFHRVENTYLSTFQTLGGLGLLLGTFGLATVLLRNVLERRRELALLRAVGYQPSHLSLMVIAENVLLLGCGLLTGVVCALLAIAPAFIARGGRLSAVSLALLLLAVLVTGLAASLLAVRAAVRSPLLAALRAE